MCEHNPDKCIDYIEFYVDDISKAKQFYSAVLEWEFTDYGPGYSSFTDGRINGGLVEEDKSKGGALVIIYAKDLESTEIDVIDAGGTIVKPVFSFPGGRRFHFTDPAGNELAVWSE
ncbi:VOC family protein [bacterium]|nr:VOC family protein [bacterium]